MLKVVVALLVLSLAGTVGSVLLKQHWTSAQTVGPTFSLGAPAFQSGTLSVPIRIEGTAFEAYAGFNVHLIWDPSLWGFQSVNFTPGIFTSQFCLPAIVDDGTAGEPPWPAGGGVTLGCLDITASSTTFTGIIAEVKLTPVGAGCSFLHLVTAEEAVARDTLPASQGTVSLDSAATVQTNDYGPDVFVNQLGAPCSPPPVTPSPTATSTPTTTPTPTPTATPTPVPLAGPDVRIAIQGNPSVVDSGGVVSYALSATNAGDSPASGVEVRLHLRPDALPFLNAACRTYSSSTLRCALPVLAASDGLPGGADTYGFIVNVQQPVLLADRSIEILVDISATNEPPGNQGNNAAQAVTLVKGCPDLNGDGIIDVVDVVVAAASYGTSEGDPDFSSLADLDSDGTVSISDLVILGSRYMQNCRGLDTDGDGLSDKDERDLWNTDDTQFDSDGDGLSDGIELVSFGSNPLVFDTDGDKYGDALEASLGKNPAAYCGVMASDLNFDHIVNIQDLVLVGASFLRFSGEPEFDPRADVNNDGVVNVADLVLVGGNYLQTIAVCP